MQHAQGMCSIELYIFPIKQSEKVQRLRDSHHARMPRSHEYPMLAYRRGGVVLGFYGIMGNVHHLPLHVEPP